MIIQTGHASSWRWRRTQTSDDQAWQTTQAIVAHVQREGDQALRRYTVEFDHCPDAASDTWAFRVPEHVLQKAWDETDRELRAALTGAADRIRRFHELQRPKDVSMDGPEGEQMGVTWRPVERVGVYAPGGRAVYPSTVMMNVIPAQVAGVREIVLATPPARETGLPHGHILAVAHLLGVREVYRIGGAQAIAALAYGTPSIPRVYKVLGPGNLYVALAKRLVMGEVGIDSIAGPSEVFIVADETANAAFVAADMLAQAEHDPEAGAVCVTTSPQLADELKAELERQLEQLPRKTIAAEALRKWGAVILADDLEQAIRLVNDSAPEHVELHVSAPRDWLPHIVYAGSVFLGEYTPEPVGDYYAGPNHILPTHGSARYASGLGVLDFMRRMTYTEYTFAALMRDAEHIERLAETEGLHAHGASVAIRVSGGNSK